MNMTEFIMLVGLPASGKSTYAEGLKEQRYSVHSSDTIREELTCDVNSQDKNTDVFSVLHKRIKSDLENGISCVYDATNISMKRRKAFLDELRKFECAKKCVLFAVPVEMCKDRNQNRERKAPDETYDRMLKNFWVPYYYEGWDEIEIQSVSEPYCFDYESMKGFSQENPHHSLDLFEHCMSAQKYACDHAYCSYVQTAAKYHDCGKLYTKTFLDSKGNKSDIAHFYGHEGYSTYLFLAQSFAGKDVKQKDEIDEILYTAALINWHMRPYTAWESSEKSKQRDQALVGDKMFHDILLLHEADRAAH